MEPNEPFFIHDHFFKGSMQQIEIAQGMSQLLLSKRILVKIDYTTLQIVKDSWINVRLNLHSTDILYRAEAGSERLHLLLLFEHKSNIDNSVSLQNYRNTSYVIEEEQSQSKSSTPKLPPVIPIVIYHGKTPWNVDNSITSMFEYIEGTEQFIPQQRSIVIDLGIMPDEEIQGIAEVKAFIMALKYSRSPLLIEKLPQTVGFFNGAGGVRLEYLEFVIRYLERFVPEEMHKEFSTIIHREYEHGDDAMKKKSFLWELGFDNGVKEGEDIGIKQEQQIEKERQKTSAVKMIKKGILIEDTIEFTGLSIDEIAELKKKSENGEL
jgi:predicted transposase/invertase (TIGR01784 family)